jgi:hypothetical protein
MPGTGQAGMELPKAVVRIGEQCIWSTFAYADTTVMASRTDRLFSVPVGSTGQGFGAQLTLAETNVREAGRIPGGYAFDVFAISGYPYYTQNTSLVGADARNFVNNCVAVWDFLQTRIEVAPFALIGAGGGLFGATADTGDADSSRELINNGNGQLWIYRTYPVMLPANTTFAFLLDWGANASAVNGGAGNSTLGIRVGLLGRFKTALAVG